MKNNKLYYVLGVIFAILVLFGASYLGRSIMNRQNDVKKDTNKEISNEYSLNGNSCYDGLNYFVISRADISGNAGDDILVKYKVNKTKEIQCKYEVENNDFELLNTPADDVPSFYYSQHFSYLEGDLLVIDEGTGTNRSFKIYDLVKREKVYSDNYSSGLSGLELEDNILTYWRKTNDIPNINNCSKINEYKSLGGGAAIEGEISLNISNLTKTKYNKFRCVYTE